MLKFFFLFFGTFLTFFAHAQENETNPIAEEGVFWKITYPNSKQSSYIFGTIHLIDKEKYNLPKSVSKQLEKADLLVMEIADLDDQRMAMEMLMLKSGRMTDILNPAQKDSLYHYIEQRFGLDSTNFEKTMGKFKPIFFLQLPYTSLVISSESYDVNINHLAMEKGIPIHGLETMQEQLSFFDDLSDELKAEMVMQVVRDTSDLKKEWNKFQTLYLNQQLSDMSSFDSGNIDGMAFYDKTLLSGRNEKWMHYLSTELKDKSVFIAVGAGHLAGQKGLLNLFKEAGYTVTRVQIKLK
jgi:uncharacterized protein